MGDDDGPWSVVVHRELELGRLARLMTRNLSGASIRTWLQSPSLVGFGGGVVVEVGAGAGTIVVDVTGGIGGTGGSVVGGA